MYKVAFLSNCVIQQRGLYISTAGPYCLACISILMYLYCIANDQGHCKFGYSVDPHKRLRTLQTGSADPLFLIETVSVPQDRVRELETVLHSEIGLHRRVRGEWFAIDSASAANLMTWFRIHYLHD